MSGRATKSGDAYRLEAKLEEKYDEMDKSGSPKAVVEWVAGVMAEAAHKIAGHAWQDIQVYLKDGVILCMLLNKLLASAGKPGVKFSAKAKTAFVAMGNIQAFNDGARSYGIPDSALFQTADLYEGRKAQMVNVVNCLSKLGFEANKKGYQPAFVPPEAPKADF